MRINKVVLVGRLILIVLRKMAAILILLGRDRSLLGTAPIGELAQKRRLQWARELEHQQQVEIRRWLQAVC